MTKKTYKDNKRALNTVKRAQYFVKRALSKDSHDQRGMHTRLKRPINIIKEP